MSDNLDMTLQMTDGDMMLLSEIDRTIDQSIARNDPTVAFKYGRGLRRGMQIQGIGLAKLLSRMETEWELFGTDVSFEEAAHTELLLAVDTIRKYVRMYRSVFDNPIVGDSIKNNLMGMPIKSLLLLTAAADEGSLQDKDWEEISQATSGTEIAQIVRRVRGTATNSDTRIIFMVNQDGSLLAKIGENKILDIGWLNLQERNEDTQRAIRKLIRSGDILEVG